jgi:hypothetical protein
MLSQLSATDRFRFPVGFSDDNRRASRSAHPQKALKASDGLGEPLAGRTGTRAVRSHPRVDLKARLATSLVGQQETLYA